MFSIVIPVFNEAKNIENLIKEIFDSLIDYKNFDIILVNDSSNDNTLEVVKKLKENSKINLINNLKNKGQSYSIYIGVKKSKYNTIVTIDGDGQNNPKDIPNLLSIYFSNEKIFLVGGIRRNRKDNYIKIISSKAANSIRSKILNDKCKDTGCSLKVFDKLVFQKFPYFNGMHRFLPALFTGYGYKTYFVDVDHRARTFGYSKYGTFDRLFRGIIDIIKVRKIIKNQKIQ